MRRVLAVSILVTWASAVQAAPDAGAPSPYTASTWTAKLQDPREVERAVTQLEQLGDPSAIPALGDAWLAQGRPVRILAVVIALAKPLTPAEAKAQFFTDYEAKGRPASWTAALPYLRRALSEVDEANPSSVDSADKAATALGEARLGLAELAALASRPASKKVIVAQLAAVRALGGFDGADKAKAAAALAKLLGRDAPKHPRTAADPTQRRALEETYTLYLATSAAALTSVAQLDVPSTVTAVVLEMYRAPELFLQARRALVAMGRPAEAALRKAIRGDSAEVNQLFKDKHLGQACERGPVAMCHAVSAREFYPAVVLGDFQDAAAVPDLLGVLKHPPEPVYYEGGDPSPNTQYNAVFDALRKIGAPAAVAPVRAQWSKPGDDATRALAIGVAPFVARDDADAAAIGAIAGDNTAEDGLRQEATLAFGRLAHDANGIALLQGLAQKYLDASAAKTREAAALQGDVAAADKAFDAAKATLDRAKAAALAATHDPKLTVEQIRAAAAAAHQAEDDYKIARNAHRAAVEPAKELDRAAIAYRGFARLFQDNIARVEIAMRCKADVGCYAASLTATPDAVARANAAYLADLATWTVDEKRDLATAAIDRAMLELGKRGAAATAYTPALLDAAVSDDRLVRQAVLLALPKIATLPCASCVAKLDAAIHAGEGKATLADVNAETAIVRSYFVWAK